jgi:hypothetical protein
VSKSANLLSTLTGQQPQQLPHNAGPRHVARQDYHNVAPPSELNQPSQRGGAGHRGRGRGRGTSNGVPPLVRPGADASSAIQTAPVDGAAPSRGRGRGRGRGLGRARPAGAV